MSFGIYALIFVGGQTYIGSTIREFSERKYEHLYDLRRGDHYNLYLQRLYNKYGEPKFKILEECQDSSLLYSKEQTWIESIPEEIRINFTPSVPNPMFGRHHSPESREKMSKIKKGIPKSPEFREMVSRTQRGRIHTPEHLKKISEALQKRDPSLRKKAKPKTPEHLKKISDALRGRRPSSATLEGNRRYWQKQKLVKQGEQND